VTSSWFLIPQLLQMMHGPINIRFTTDWHLQ